MSVSSQTIECFRLRTVGSGTVIETDTPSELVGAGDNVSITRASTAGPPAATGVRNCVWVGGTSARLSDGDIGNSDARCVNLSDPLLHLGGVRRRQLVERRIVGWVDVDNLKDEKSIQARF